MKAGHRLSSADFRRLRPSRRLSGEFFSLSIASSEGRALKWACVVSKKVSARAVVRNRVKRLCRSALQPLLKNRSEPLALVFHAKRPAAEASFADIQRDVERLLLKSR